MDNLGVKYNPTPSVRNFSFDKQTKELIVDEIKTESERANLRRALFKTGALIVTATPFNGFYSKEFKRDVSDFAVETSSQAQVPAKTKLLILKEGLIRTKYNLGSAFGFVEREAKQVDLCFRYLKTLASDVKGNLVYITLFINPDLDIVDLQKFFKIDESAIINTNSSLQEYDITTEIEKKMAKRKEEYLKKTIDSFNQKK